MRKIILAVLLLVAGFSQGQIINNDCNRLKHSKLKYVGSREVSFVEINETSHKEYYKNDDKYLRSELTWNEDCDCGYTAKITENTFSNKSLKVGEVLTAKIIKIEGDVVCMEVTCRGIRRKLTYKILEYL